MLTAEENAIKNSIREKKKAARENISPEDRGRMSRDITSRLVGLPEYVHAGVICCYISMGSEVETRNFVRQMLTEKSRTVVVPVMGKDSRLYLSKLEDMSDLSRGAYGILEPFEEKRVHVSFDAVNLFIVPGIAFDPAGNRIGRGAGHYDMLLEKVKAPKIGLAYADQIVQAIPAESHDIKMTKIITNLEVITCGKTP